MTDADRGLWLQTVPALQVKLEGVVSPLYMTPKVFSTGSVGYYYSGKCVVGDSPCQANFCLTVINTKRMEDTNGQLTHTDEQPNHDGQTTPKSPGEGRKGKKGK